jgi:hypothetical protein
VYVRKLEKKSDANGVSNKACSSAGKSKDLHIISGTESVSQTQGERGNRGDASELQGGASENAGRCRRVDLLWPYLQAVEINVCQ